MERKTVLKLKNELGAKPSGSRERLVIHVAPPVEGPGVPPSPEVFRDPQGLSQGIDRFCKIGGASSARLFGRTF